MFYCITILACMAIIAVCNILFAPFGLSVWQNILAVTFSTVAVIAVDGIFATIIRRAFPTKWFSHEKKIFQVSKKEQRFYDKLGIKKWKDKVLELGAFTSFRKNKVREPNNNEYISRFLLENNYGFIIHIACVVLGFLIIFMLPLKYALCFGVPVGIVNAVLNLLPAFILRYNTPKLMTLYKFNARKAQKGQTDAENGEINNANKQDDEELEVA